MTPEQIAAMDALDKANTDANAKPAPGMGKPEDSSGASSSSSFSRVLARTASCTSNSSRVTRSSLLIPDCSTPRKFVSRSSRIERKPSGTDSASFLARFSIESSLIWN